MIGPLFAFRHFFNSDWKREDDGRDDDVEEQKFGGINRRLWRRLVPRLSRPVSAHVESKFQNHFPAERANRRQVSSKRWRDRDRLSKTCARVWRIFTS